MSNEYWSSLSLNTPYKYGDRITVGAPEMKGTVTVFIGKKRETIIVHFEDNPGQSVSIKKDQVIELARKDNRQEVIRLIKTSIVSILHHGALLHSFMHHGKAQITL